MKVIGFDCWTLGARHYQRLVEAFRNKGLELVLIHLGEWGDEKGRPAEEWIGALPVRNISFYAGRGLREILEREQPAAVIFTSTDPFAHRAFNRYCRERNVPTIHLFHGLQHLMDIPFKTRPLRRLWLMRSHFAKLVRHSLPVYTRSLWETRATAGEWYRFATDIAHRLRGRRLADAADDSKTDRACIYIAPDSRCAVQRYGHSEPEVFAVGNPDLISFGLTPTLVGCCANVASESDSVVYLDTALTDYGVVYKSKEDFIHHIVESSVELSRQGKRLFFKPHPAHTPAVLAAIEDAGVHICRSDELLTRLRGSCACITEPSSAALIPALMGLPLMLARYGRLRGQVFGDFLESYPRAHDLGDLRDFSSLLAAESRAVNPQRTLRWIEQNTGPLPAQDMPSRVANVVLGAIAERQAAWPSDH